jgi:hypothetical protein
MVERAGAARAVVAAAAQSMGRTGQPLKAGGRRAGKTAHTSQDVVRITYLADGTDPRAPQALSIACSMVG